MNSRWRLMLVTDEIHFRRGVAEEQILRAILGGVTIIQLREKKCADRDFIHLARRMLIVARKYRVPLIINDRIRVASAARADGVHLGQSDDSPEYARETLGPGAIIGLSVETENEVIRARSRPVDYLGVSAIFSTSSKKDIRTEWGLAGLRHVRGLTPQPLIAIGGINEKNSASVLAAGADGIAVISNFQADTDWKIQAQKLTQALKGETHVNWPRTLWENLSIRPECRRQALVVVVHVNHQVMR